MSGDDVLERWKREAGSPLSVRIAVALFLWFLAVGFLLYDRMPGLVLFLCFADGIGAIILAFRSSLKVGGRGPLMSRPGGRVSSFYLWLLYLPPRRRAGTSYGSSASSSAGWQRCSLPSACA